MSPAYKSLLSPVRSFPSLIERENSSEPQLSITVVFTSVDATLTALREAGRLADRLGGGIELVVPQVVPYPLPLTRPSVLLGWNALRFRVMAADSPVETKILLYLCRDRVETLIARLRPQSVVVLSGPKRWWPTSESRLACALRRAGHQVIFKEME